MKLKTLERTEIKKTKTPIGLVRVFIEAENVVLNKASEKMKSLTREIEEHLAKVEMLKPEITKYEGIVASLTAEAPETERRVKEKADTLFNQLRRHAAVESVSATTTGSIRVRTKLIFVPIREREGSRKENRACIGAFDIKMGVTTNEIKIENLTFHAARAHWAVSRGTPCLGSYENDVRSLQRAKDYYQMFDVLFHFLRSTDDGSAYMRSHTWRDTMRNVEIPAGTQRFEEGDYVVNISHNSDGKDLFGFVGKVYSAGEINLAVEYKKEMGGHDGKGGKDGHCWASGKSEFLKITKEQYDAGEVMKVGVSDAIGKIDALPDGSTQEDVEKLISSLVTK